MLKIMMRVLFICTLFIFYFSIATAGDFPTLDELNPNHPVIIVDIDHTIADVSGWKFLFLDYKEVKQLPDASKYLTLLGQQFQIIYLTARHEYLKERTYKWLEYNSFPKAPVLFWNLADFPFWSEDYKTQRIGELKKQFGRILFGVGDKKTDMKAYLSNNLYSFIFNENVEKRPRVEIVKNWQEIYQKVLSLYGH